MSLGGKKRARAASPRHLRRAGDGTAGRPVASLSEAPQERKLTTWTGVRGQTGDEALPKKCRPLPMLGICMTFCLLPCVSPHTSFYYTCHIKSCSICGFGLTPRIGGRWSLGSWPTFPHLCPSGLTPVEAAHLPEGHELWMGTLLKLHQTTPSPR